MMETMERETGLEPATSSLEGSHRSAIKLQPRLQLVAGRTRCWPAGQQSRASQNARGRPRTSGRVENGSCRPNEWPFTKGFLRGTRPEANSRYGELKSIWGPTQIYRHASKSRYRRDA